MILVNNVLSMFACPNFNKILHLFSWMRLCLKNYAAFLENLLPQPVFDIDNQWNGRLVATSKVVRWDWQGKISACKQCDNTYLIPPFSISLRQRKVKRGEDNHTCSTLFPSWEKIFVEYIGLFICINLRKVCIGLCLCLYDMYIFGFSAPYLYCNGSE